MGADMEFRVPDPVWVGDLSEAESVWPGIGSGASTSNELVQAGWEQDQRYYLGVTSHNYSAWYQIAPQTDQINLDDVIAQSGETVWAHVDWEPDTKHAEFLVCNVDRDFTCANVTQDVDGDVGDQAEWVVERTELCSAFSCSLPSLPETTSPVEIYCPTAFIPNGTGSIGYNAVNFSPTAVSMYDCSGTLLAWPTALDDTEFSVQKEALGNSDSPDCK